MFVTHVSLKNCQALFYLRSVFGWFLCSMHLPNPTQIFPNTCELTVLEFNVVDFRAAEPAHNSLLFQFKRKHFCLHVKL